MDTEKILKVIQFVIDLLTLSVNFWVRKGISKAQIKKLKK